MVVEYSGGIPKIMECWGMGKGDIGHNSMQSHLLQSPPQSPVYLGFITTDIGEHELLWCCIDLQVFHINGQGLW